MKLSLLTLFRASALPLLVAASACTQATVGGSDSTEGAATEGAKLGDYYLNNGNIQGTLTLKATGSTSLTFALSLVQDHMPHNMGDADGKATGSNGHYVYKGDGDCTIDFKVADTGIAVDQKGICGMGMGVYSTGTYTLAGGDPTKLRAGQYEQLAIALHGSSVTGWVRDSVGDPAHGGATCEFIVMGTLGSDETSTDVKVTDGYDTIDGKLLLKGDKSVALQMAQLPNACGRMFQQDEFAKEGGYAFKLGSLLAPEVQGFRTVKADKAYFHEAPDGPAGKAYIVKGDTVQIIGGDDKFPQVDFTPWFEAHPDTVGFVDASDLVPLP
jgi:hypothetical protein